MCWKTKVRWFKAGIGNFAWPTYFTIYSMLQKMAKEKQETLKKNFQRENMNLITTIWRTEWNWSLQIEVRSQNYSYSLTNRNFTNRKKAEKRRDGKGYRGESITFLTKISIFSAPRGWEQNYLHLFPAYYSPQHSRCDCVKPGPDSVSLSNHFEAWRLMTSFWHWWAFKRSI